MGYMSEIILHSSKSVNSSRASFLVSGNVMGGSWSGFLQTSNPKNRFRIKFDDFQTHDDGEDDDSDGNFVHMIAPLGPAMMVIVSCFA